MNHDSLISYLKLDKKREKWGMNHQRSIKFSLMNISWPIQKYIVEFTFLKCHERVNVKHFNKEEENNGK